MSNSPERTPANTTGATAFQNSSAVNSTALEVIAPPLPETDAPDAGLRTVLVIAAHPDDPEFSSAGTMATWVAAGLNVVYVLVTSGDKGTANASMLGSELSSSREREQVAAAHEVGVEKVEFLRFPDGELYPDLKLRGAITRMIRRYRPYAVFTHDPLTLFYNNEFINHPDHRAVGTATVDSIYPTARDPLNFPEHLSTEGLQPHKVKQIYLWGTDSPNVVVDISAAVDKKIASLKHHFTQVGDNSELDQRVRQRAAEIGALGGVAFGEGFRRVIMRS